MPSQVVVLEPLLSGSDPALHWKTTTFTAGLRATDIAAPMVIDGPTDGDAFRTYVAAILVPELKFGDIVIMDNLPAHRVSDVREAIEQAGARLLYSPIFSRLQSD